MIGCYGLEGGKMRTYCLMGIDLKIQFYKMKRVIEIDGGDGCTIL